jgi:hypothetical protein
MTARKRSIYFGGRPKFKFKTSASFVNGSGSGATVTLPSSISAGDLVVIWDTVSASGSVTLKKLADFSTAVSDTFSASGFAGAIFTYKYASASDAGRSYTASTGTGAVSVVLVLVFSVVGGTFSSCSSGDPSIDLGSGGTPPAQSVTGSTPPSIAFALFMQFGGISSTFTPAADASVSAGGGFVQDIKVSYKIFDDAAVTEAITLGATSGQSCLAGCYINGNP